MGKLNFFLREKITDLDTPEIVIETEKEYTIQDYDKRNRLIKGEQFFGHLSTSFLCYSREIAPVINGHTS